MVIIRVSKSSENVMLSTVRILRRLLRNALLVTKRVKVIGSDTCQLRRVFPERESTPSALVVRIKQGLGLAQLVWGFCR
jgi:hypothetical protein